MCETKILTRTPLTEIDYCVKCRSVFLWHNNILMTFSEEEFSTFHSTLGQYDFSECSMLFSDKVHRISICTPYNAINLVFDLTQWLDLRQAMEEASCMKEIYALLHRPLSS